MQSDAVHMGHREAVDFIVTGERARGPRGTAGDCRAKLQHLTVNRKRERYLAVRGGWGLGSYDVNMEEKSGNFRKVTFREEGESLLNAGQEEMTLGLKTIKKG